MENVTTTTGIKADVLEKFSLDAEGIAETLHAELLGSAPVKKDLTKGVYVYDEGDSVFVYTTDEHDVTEEYTLLGKDDQKKCWIDGFKRQHINRPAHEAVKAGLGIKEETKTSKTVRSTEVKVLSNMVLAGVPNEAIYATFPDLPREVIDEAIKANS